MHSLVNNIYLNVHFNSLKVSVYSNFGLPFFREIAPVTWPSRTTNTVSIFTFDF